MASDADQVDDPYKQLRGQVQHAVGSGHFDRAIELLQSLSDATSPRMEGELFGGGASSIDQIFRLDSDFGFNLTKQVSIVLFLRFLYPPHRLPNSNCLD